ncbi:hypothetical protein PLICRDRAFT_49298 [Plicaturopsis crispa FD-325 SS-3]|nr:hypothetical protein PLICRDRAFT_49298 [Plicaturopsis crispa FD-325 SS-3]
MSFQFNNSPVALPFGDQPLYHSQPSPLNFDTNTSTSLHYPPSSPSDASYSPNSPSGPPFPAQSHSLPPYQLSSTTSSTAHSFPGTADAPADVYPPSYSPQPPPYTLHPRNSSTGSGGEFPGTARPFARSTIAHPYARLANKKDAGKRRKIWNHALEKSLFTPHELSTMGAPHRRTIYMSSLEAHVDRLHAQLLSIGLYPIPFEKLEPFRGLNSKTAKSMIAALQHDDSYTKLKLLELQRANANLRQILERPAPHTAAARRHSTDAAIPASADFSSR